MTLPSSHQNSLSLDVRDEHGRTQLHRAVFDGSEGVAKGLLFNGAAVDIEDHVRNEPLHYAVLGNSVIMAEILARYGADVDSKGQLGRSPLHMSVSSNHMVDILLKAQAFISCQDEKGDTPLHLAISSVSLERNSDITVVKTLINAGADVNIANIAGVTPFHIAVDHITQDVTSEAYKHLELLLTSRADISLRTRDNRLPFEVFLGKSGECWSGPGSYYRNSMWNACFRLFLSKGGDPYTKIQSGERLVHHFIREKLGSWNGSWNVPWNADQELAELLCKRADPGIMGENGNYLLHELTSNVRRQFSTRYPVTNLVRIMLDNEADPNQRNRSGKTPLMLLLNRKSNNDKAVSKVLDLLLARGAVPMPRDASGHLPIYDAVTNFPKAAWKLGQALLHSDNSDNSLEEDAMTSRNNARFPDDARWWQTWDLVKQGTNWERAKVRLGDAQDSLPANVRKMIHTIALGVLAERYLKVAKIKFTAEYSNLDEHRRYITAILREYRQMNIKADPTWIDYLLDLCK
jgi:ankyrin repeat protein